MPAQPAMRRSVPSGLWLLPLLCLLAACGGGGSRLAHTGAYAPGDTVYPEPGPPGDPWRPYIRDASSRFSVPQAWIRAVMHQESGGNEYRNGQPIVSGAGAMGLMQLMPATYADLQSQYGLGNDPFEPHDNILAGTAYINQMYRKYGAPAFLAAYNAGPQRLEDYLYRGRSLPNETVNYVASIAPNLGTEIAMSGPLAAYATGGTPDASPPPVQLASYQMPVSRGRSRRRRGGVCWHDPDAAYDPDAPCQTPPPAPIAAPIAPTLAAPVAVADAGPVAPPIGQAAGGQAAGGGACLRDPDAAFDSPCQTMPSAPVWTPPARTVPAYADASSYSRPQPMPVLARAAAPAPSYGNWSIQVGAYASVEQARFATTAARQADYARLAGSQSVVQPTTPFGHGVLYRARLAGLARADAGQACSTLSGHGIPCMVVQPGG